MYIIYLRVRGPIKCLTQAWAKRRTRAAAELVAERLKERFKDAEVRIKYYRK